MLLSFCDSIVALVSDCTLLQGTLPSRVLLHCFLLWLFYFTITNTSTVKSIIIVSLWKGLLCSCNIVLPKIFTFTVSSIAMWFLLLPWSTINGSLLSLKSVSHDAFFSFRWNCRRMKCYQFVNLLISYIRIIKRNDEWLHVDHVFY